MSLPENSDAHRVPLSRSQQNIYRGAAQDDDHHLYLIGRSYRFRPIPQAVFLSALSATILANPVQLCVLVAPSDAGDYPDLAPRLGVDDIVRVCGADEDTELAHEWRTGILQKPLARYTVRIDGRGLVHGLDAQAHHILLDGGAIGVIEADLGRFLAGGGSPEDVCVRDGLTRVATAHRREAARIDESLQRLTVAVQRELAAAGEPGGHGQAADGPGSAARGVLVESVVIRAQDYDDVLALADRENVPLNVLVAAAATAVDAASRGCTDTLLVHALDNRFGDPDLDVATCLVNSVAQPVRFPPHASVAEVVGAVDRGYVKAGRRRWLREEHYRRMYLAINRTRSVETLTLNFLPEPSAPALMPFLVDPPVTTHIGPVEGLTVAAVLDEQRRTLTLNIWDRHEQPRRTAIGFAGRVASALTSMTAMWDLPIAATVDAWHSIDEDGRLCSESGEPVPEEPAAPAWFLARSESIDECRRRRGHVDPWIAWLLEIEAAPGDVLVFADDGADQAIDLMIACHLAGCGYSVCDRSDQVGRRAEAIRAHGDGIAVHVVDIDSADSQARAAERRALIEARVEQTVTDPGLAARTAYVVPTSGSTGEPKLVRVSHGSLAKFCVGMTRAYGWSPEDTILQCAPLTSDISVEEVFGAASTGATLVRSAAVKAGDLQALSAELVARSATVVDLPTALWHLWCEDADAMAAIGSSQLRQVVIGGEAIRPGTVDKWVNTAGTEGISLVSSYGPTETTVVVTYLPIIDGGRVVEHGARLRLGRPLVPHTVAIAFGEVVVVGEMVADGYLGVNGAGFGVVTTAGGRRYRAYATGDRVTVDGAGYPVFAGRRDALVKVSGKRVDTATITRTIMADPAILDIAVELHNGGLGVWFETQRTRGGDEDPAAAARIRRVLMDSRVASFVVTGVAGIPRKPNGKTDTARLHTVAGAGPHRPTDERSDEQAAGLAGLWSAHLERLITPHTSLLSEGIGSLDLVRILPDTRRHLGRQVSILDLISADTAANLVQDMSVGDDDAGSAAEIERDFTVFATPGSGTLSNPGRPPGRDAGPVLVLGASGILGTGFAEAILDLTREQRPEVVLAMRSVPPDNPAWMELRRMPGVRLEHLSPGFGPAELEALIRRTGSRTVVNCIGNTNVVVPYRELRSANVELVAAMAQICAAAGTRLVHLSTYVVNADVTAPQVVDPRQAPYPYAATKALAELAVGRGSELDFTIVRLPRVLGTPEQLRESTDILVSIADACHALQACPAVDLTEEVTTGHAAATSILRRLLELGESGELGRGIEVLRGQAVAYRELLGGIASRELDSHEWKRRLDESDWAKANPQRWSVIDAWIGLGLKLDGRSYAEYLAAYPALQVGVRSVGELVAPPPSLRELLAYGAAGTRGSRPTTYQPDTARQ